MPGTGVVVTNPVNVGRVKSSLKARGKARRDQSLAFGDGAAVARGAVHQVTIEGWSTRRQSAVESVRESRTNARSLVLRSPLALHTANSGR